MAKRILTIVLTLCMVLGTMSFSVMAAEVTVATADDFYAAVRDAQPGDIINLEASVEYDVWNSVANKNNLTINGNGNTITVTTKIDSGINGGGLLRNATNLTINDLIVALPSTPTAEMERLATMKSGTLNNVTVTGGSFAVSILGGDGDVVINNCNFSNINGWAVETEGKGNTGLTISNSTFDEKAVIIRGEDNTFTGNTITGSGDGVNVLGTAIITGNDFGESTLAIDSGRDVTIEKNVINNVEFPNWFGVAEEDYSNVTVENNTLGDSALSSMQNNVDSSIVSVDPVATIGDKGYYTIADAVAEATNGDVVKVYPGTHAAFNVADDKDGITIEAADPANKPVISIMEVNDGGVEYHASDLTFRNLVFKVEEGCAPASTWNVSALGYYYETVKDREGLKILNCDFINNSDIGMSAIAANISKYTISGCSFKNFTTGVHSFMDHVILDNVTITDNTYENVDMLVNVYYGAAATSTSTITVQNNTSVDDSTTRIVIDDFGMEQDPPVSAYDSITASGNDADVVIGNYQEDEYTADLTDNTKVVYNYKNQELALANAPENVDIYLNYGSSSETKAVITDGNIEYTELADVEGKYAFVNGAYYDTIAEAVVAANPGDVIDLMGKIVDLPEVYSLNITKDLTIQNGTIDIANGVWSANSIIEVHGGSDADPVELTMNNVDVVGDNYSSAFGVVYAYNYGKVILNNCNFELADEAASAGGVLKGNGVAQSEFVVKDSTFMLENPNRVITNATVTIENTTIDAKVTDDTLAVGTMNNHALRAIEGTISNSTITIDGFESGVKNSGGEALVIEDNSTVELKNSIDADVNLSADAAIELKEDSKLIALNYKDDSSKDSVSSDDTSAVVDKVAYLPEAPVAEVYAGRTLADARLTGTTVYTEVYGDVLGGVWNFVDPTEVMDTAGVYQKEIIFTPDDTTYDEIDIMIDVTVRELASRPSTSVGGTGGSTTPAKITVKFNTNGGSEISDVKVEKGETVEAPEAPVKENNIFIGWFADKDLTEEFDFDTEIKKATTIYAGWVKITAENSIVLVIGETNATVFGEEAENDVAPLIVNDRTMLPARFVAESLGANVEWDEENQKVTITKDETVIEIFIGKTYAMVNGEEVELDSAAFIENSRTYTPVRFISENLGAHVDWDDETKTVTIVKVK